MPPLKVSPGWSWGVALTPKNHLIVKHVGKVSLIPLVCAE
jgi:hypothetical protein